ncbi:TetR/AcrR family transcriptional regulator [Streptococcus pluranimalium]
MERVKRKESLFVESAVEALWELLEDKFFEKISVSELVERAGIGRVTFYRNFSNKEEVLERSFNLELQAWLLKRQIDLSDWSDAHLLLALRQFFDFWYEQQDKIRLLTANHLDYLLEEVLERYFKERLGDLTDDFHLQFIVGGFFRVLKTWVARGCKESPDDIMRLMGEQ